MNLQKPLLKLGAWKYSMFAGILAWALACTNVMRSTWSGDDWPNSQAPYLILWRYGKISFQTVYTEAMYWNNQWMIGQGRFYPLSWIETRFAFSYFRDLWQYKLLESTMLFVSGLLLVALIFLISSSNRLAIFATFALPVFVQFRNDFDPHLAFGFMVESLLIKVEIACIFAYLAGKATSSIKNALFSILAGIMLFAGCCTYEYAFLLFPLVVTMYWAGIGGIEFDISTPEILKKKSFGLSFITLSWLGYAVYVFGFLRMKAVAISGAYVLSISWKSIYVFVTQIFAPLPFTNFSGNDLFRKGNIEAIWAIVGGIFMFSIYSYFIAVFNRIPYKSFASQKNITIKENRLIKIRIAIIGLTLIVAPSFMLAIQPIWWNKASIVHSYLGILLSEFGYVVFFALGFDWWLTRIMPTKVEKKFIKGRK